MNRPPAFSSVHLRAALAAVPEHWSPRMVDRVGGRHVRVTDLFDDPVWHKHDDGDEPFLVLRGTMHSPGAEDECGIALVETVTIRHMGGVATLPTRSAAEQLGA